MKKTIPYKKFDIVVGVNLNSVDPPPPAFHDTAPRHMVFATVDAFAFVHHKNVSDLHLSAELKNAEKAAKDFIDEQTKLPPAKLKLKTSKHIKQLIQDGFEE